MRDYVQVPRPLLRQGEGHHQGHFFTANLALAAATPIPLFLVALRPAAFRLAGGLADGEFPFLYSIPYLTDTALPALREGEAAAAQPRPPIVAQQVTANPETKLCAGLCVLLDRKKWKTLLNLIVYHICERRGFVRAGLMLGFTTHTISLEKHDHLPFSAKIVSNTPPLSEPPAFAA